MKVTEFTTTDGKKTIILTDQQERALEHAERLTRTGYRRIRQFDGTPTYTDVAIRGMLLDYDGMTSIAPATDCAGAYIVVDPMNRQLEEQRETFELALKCAKYKFGCNVVTLLAEHATTELDEFVRVADSIRVALLVIAFGGADH